MMDFRASEDLPFEKTRFRELNPPNTKISVELSVETPWTIEAYLETNWQRKAISQNLP